MEFNKVLLSLVLVNGVLVNSLQAKPVNLDTDLNRLVAEYGPVNSTAPIDKETVFNLVEASAETTDPVQSNAASAMVRAQISDDTTLSGIGKKRGRISDGDLNTDEVDLVKEALNPAKSQADRQGAAKRLKTDSKSAPVSAPAPAPAMGSASGSSASAVDRDAVKAQFIAAGLNLDANAGEAAYTAIRNKLVSAEVIGRAIELGLVNVKDLSNNSQNMLDAVVVFEDGEPYANVILQKSSPSDLAVAAAQKDRNNRALVDHLSVKMEQGRDRRAVEGLLRTYSLLS